MGYRKRIGHGLAKVLGIELENTDNDGLTRGESVFSTRTADTFIEEEPTTAEALRKLIPTGHATLSYLSGLFPFTTWIGFYNLQWFVGDLIAGITIGAVLIPQGMAYAKLASLPVEFGLYSSFAGVAVYWFFATSKDITIGPVAVASTVTGSVVRSTIEKYPEYADQPWVVASSLGVVCGAIIAFIGLIRCGWIVELIPVTSLAAFMTGSALQIASGQVATLMGISGVSSHDSTYLIIINTLKGLPTTSIDAAMGLTALALLYAIRFGCGWAANRFSKWSKVFFFAATLRAVFVILLYTMISWLVNMNRKDNPAFEVLGKVPVGFQHVQVPTLNSKLFGSFVSELPAACIVLLIEHIAISKSFGRVNNYTINPSQEMVGIGITNIVGPFLGGYPATGSFSRTAINSKAGVRTPFGGVITALLVLLAIYCLSHVFFYIPQSSLSAVIIHAVGDLITPPNTIYRFWRISPLEPFIFFIGVIVAVFSTIEDGIYVTIVLSFAIFMFRTLKSKGAFLGRVKVHSVIGDHVLGPDDRKCGEYGTFNNNSDTTLTPSTRNVFLPYDNRDGSNPELDVQSPYPGVFIYRFAEGFNYPSANHTLDYLVGHIFENTRRTKLESFKRKGDRPWNDPGPKKGQVVNTDLPTLKAVILDFSSVNHVDVTSVQRMIDVRNQLDRYAAPEPVDWHFACINNRWTKRALVSAGFGYMTEEDHARWQSIFNIAEIGGGFDSAEHAADLEAAHEKEAHDLAAMQDIENMVAGAEQTPTPPSAVRFQLPDQDAGASDGSGFDSPASASTLKSPPPNGLATPDFSRGQAKRLMVHGLNRPLFHVDLTSALQSAITNVEAREEIRSRRGSRMSGVTPPPA
ncbi:sulfate permease [Xylariomycetidae sp. FL0641]|nr:sulfate permease [Xylariomycetidae sp. FL0641]